MADIDKEVKVIVSAADQYSTQFAAFLGSLGGIGAALGVAVVAFAAAGAAASAFAYAIGKEVVLEAADFQNAMFDVFAVAQSAGTSLQDVDGILSDLTNRFPVTGAQAGEAMETIAQLGFGAKEELEALSEAALNLSIATSRDMNTAALLLTATMNAFNLTAADSEHLVNLFAAAQFNSAAAIDDVQISMQHAGATFKATGNSIEDTVTALAFLRNAGIDASIAGTALRGVYAALAVETTKGAGALAKLGLTYDDLSSPDGSPMQFRDIIKVLEGTQIGFNEATQIFGRRAGPQLLTILNQGSEAFNEFSENLKTSTAGIDAVAIKMETWRVVTANLAGSMSLLKKTIGIDLLGAVIDTIGVTEKDGIRGIITVITELEKEQGRIGGILTDSWNRIREAAGMAFTQSFGDAEGFYEFLGDSMSTIVELGETFVKLGISFGQTAIAVVDGVNTMADGFDDLDAAYATGIGLSIDDFSTKAEKLGIGFEDVDAGIDSLTVAMGQMDAQAEENAETFGVLGLSADEVRKKTESTTAAVEAAKFEYIYLYDAQGNVIGQEKVMRAEIDATKKTTEEMTDKAKELQKTLAQEMKIKILELEAMQKITAMQEETKRVGDLLKFKAEVDIAKIEAAAEVMSAQFEAVAAHAQVVEAAISNIGEIADIDLISAREIAKAAADIAQGQVKLMAAQTEYMQAQADLLQLQKEAIERGDNVGIQVEVIGDTRNWLEGLLNDLLEQIIIQASAEAFTCLCGSLPTT
jgi:TP901 family phage tail tape measure protein